MVNPVSNSGPGPIETQRVVTKIATHGGTTRGAIADDATPAARLAKLGPPIDINRVGVIRAAIADGSYTVDADRLAAAMLALDLPVSIA